MESISKRLKALSDPGRAKALYLLSQTGELCVCEIQVLLGLSPFAASRALKSLEDQGWLSSRKQGRWVYYQVAEQPAEWEGMLGHLVLAMESSAEGEEIREQLRKLTAEKEASCCGGGKDN